MAKLDRNAAIGTAHFKSWTYAVRYYRRHGGYTSAQVEQKLAEGEIAIGEPVRVDGSRIDGLILDGDGRYWIPFSAVPTPAKKEAADPAVPAPAEPAPLLAPSPSPITVVYRARVDFDCRVVDGHVPDRALAALEKVLAHAQKIAPKGSALGTYSGCGACSPYVELEADSRKDAERFYDSMAAYIRRFKYLRVL